MKVTDQGYTNISRELKIEIAQFVKNNCRDKGAKLVYRLEISCQRSNSMTVWQDEPIFVHEFLVRAGRRYDAARIMPTYRREFRHVDVRLYCMEFGLPHYVGQLFIGNLVDYQ